MYNNTILRVRALPLKEAQGDSSVFLTMVHFKERAGPPTSSPSTENRSLQSKPCTAATVLQRNEATQAAQERNSASGRRLRMALCLRMALSGKEGRHPTWQQGPQCCVAGHCPGDSGESSGALTHCKGPFHFMDIKF